MKRPEFRRFTDFPRGTMYDILCDAYSYDDRNKGIWDSNWKESDDFFYDNPQIADKYGLITCIDGEPIGFVTWDPRNSPEYVEIGHNGIREKYKRQGYGHAQLEEALRRIREYEGLKRIIVCTNSNLAAPKNYESVGFQLYDRKPNKTESPIRLKAPIQAITCIMRSCLERSNLRLWRILRTDLRE